MLLSGIEERRANMILVCSFFASVISGVIIEKYSRKRHDSVIIEKAERLAELIFPVSIITLMAMWVFKIITFGGRGLVWIISKLC